MSAPDRLALRTQEIASSANPQRNALTGQFIRFALIGVSNTAVHYAVFALLVTLFSMQYLIASAIGYVCGLINSYLLNRSWTFRARARPMKRRVGEFVRFGLVNALALTVNLLVMRGLVELMSVTPYISQLFAIGLALVVNFLGNRFWTFRAAMPDRAPRHEGATSSGRKVASSFQANVE